jgi:hypothetical protein
MRNALATPQSLLSQMTLSHGPVGILGRTILLCDALARQRGVTLSIVSAEEFLAANQANTSSWLPLLKLFDCRFNDLSRDNALFLVGRNRDGDIVACQAARSYVWEGTNFKEEAESLRMFYRDPAAMKEPDEKYTVSSLGAKGTDGRVVYSGAAWYRRDHRGIGLVEWLPRIARAYARGVWDSRTTVTLMSKQNVAKGVFPRNGYRNLEWDVHLQNREWGDVRYAYLWLKENEMIDDLKEFLAGHAAADVAVGAVRAEHQSIAALRHARQ